MPLPQPAPLPQADGLRALIVLEGADDYESQRKAARGFEDRCAGPDGGDARACYHFEGMMRTGGARRDRPLPPRAVVLDRECQGGDHRSCFQLGLLLDDDGGMPRDGARAFALFEQACEAGYRYACFRSAIYYRVSVPSQRPDAAERVVERLGRACKAGFARPCTMLAEALRDQGGDGKLAADAAGLGCARGDLAGCRQLAVAALPTRPFACDQCEGESDMHGGCLDCRLWADYERLCCDSCPDRDTSAACADIELTKRHPKVSREVEPAAVATAERQIRALLNPWLQRLGESCKAGHGQACFDLGLLAADARFPTHNAAIAKAAVGRSCELYYASGCARLAEQLAASDPERAAALRKRAIRLLDEACQGGHGSSCWGRARLERDGRESH